MTAISARVRAQLRCPSCGGGFDDGDALRCTAGHGFDTSRGYLDLATDAPDEATRRTLASFGYEWTTFDAIQPEDETFWKNYFRDVPLDALRGSLALDAGCGKARFSRFTAPHTGELVALDGSNAVEAAVKNLAPLDNTVVVRSDVRTVPFADGAFDFVSCLGVLHHLPEPRVGFAEMVRVLKPGGRLLVYLYSRPDGHGVRASALAAAARIRRLTVRMPHRPLRLLSAPVAALLYLVFVVPGALGARLGIGALSRLPLHTYRNRPVRSLWLDTFDRFSAPSEVRYVWRELEPWFADAGLDVEAAREDAGWYVVARKPG